MIRGATNYRFSEKVEILSQHRGGWQKVCERQRGFIDSEDPILSW